MEQTLRQDTDDGDRTFRPTILVVEDDALVRSFIVATLLQEGYRVIQTNSGKRAKRLIHSHKGPIALAVCDIQMPAGNGLDFAVALEALRPGVPVLFISGLIDSVAVQGILLRKPCSILTKPFSGEALVDRVRLLAGATLTTPLLERPASHTGSEGKAQK